MCAIVDANVAAEVFGSNQPEAGKQFFKWINKGKGRLVVGGNLTKELESSRGFREWGQQALLAGRMRIEEKGKVDARTKELRAKTACRSNDQHVIALAQVSGARLLYSNDLKLHQDFKDGDLINHPRGRVYSTLQDRDFTDSHRGLLGRSDLCQVKQ